MMQRSLTPTSPSPSPPPTNPQSQPNAHHSLLPPNQTLNPTPTSTSNSTSHPNTTSIIPVPTSSDNRGPSQAAAAASSSSLVQPSIPISEAAAAENARQDLESATHSLVQSLYDLAQCTNDITKGEERMIPDKINEIVDTLAQLDTISDRLTQQIPKEALNSVDGGRNPDIHSRYSIGRLLSDNQRMRGATSSLYDYRNKLAQALTSNFPDLEEVVKQDDKALESIAGRNS